MPLGQDLRGEKMRYKDDRRVLLAELFEEGSGTLERLKVIDVCTRGAALCGKHARDRLELRAEAGLIREGQIRVWVTNADSRGPIDVGTYRVVRRWGQEPIPGIGIAVDMVKGRWVHFIQSPEFVDALRRPPGDNVPEDYSAEE